MARTTSPARLLIAVVLGLALLAACGSSPDTSAEDTADTSAEDTAEPPRLGVTEESVLDFTAPTLAGSDLDAASLKGKPAVFWFWAPWCSVCRGEAPGVERVAADLGDDIAFVGVPGLGEVPAMKEFVDQTGVTSLNHAIDDDGSLWKRFGITSQPSYVFVTSEGDVRSVKSGMSEADFKQAASDLVGN